MTAAEARQIVCAWCAADVADGADPPTRIVCDRCAVEFRVEAMYSFLADATADYDRLAAVLDPTPSPAP